MFPLHSELSSVSWRTNCLWLILWNQLNYISFHHVVQNLYIKGNFPVYFDIIYQVVQQVTEANLFDWLNILYDDLQSGQRPLETSSLIWLVGMVKPVIRTVIYNMELRFHSCVQSDTYGIRMSLLPGVVSIREKYLGPKKVK